MKGRFGLDLFRFRSIVLGLFFFLLSFSQRITNVFDITSMQLNDSTSSTDVGNGGLKREFQTTVKGK